MDLDFSWFWRPEVPGDGASRLVSDESALHHPQAAAFLLCSQGLSFSSCKPVSLDRGPTLTTSFHLYHFLLCLSPDTVTLELGLQCTNLSETNILPSH